MPFSFLGFNTNQILRIQSTGLPPFEAKINTSNSEWLKPLEASPTKHSYLHDYSFQKMLVIASINWFCYRLPSLGMAKFKVGPINALEALLY